MSELDDAVARLAALPQPKPIEDGNTIFNRGWNEALERAARRVETANDETKRTCISAAIRAMKH